MMAARLLAYRRRWFVIAWLLLLIALSGATVSAYQSTYSTPQQRQIATDLAQNNAATVLLYGDLHSSGTPAVMFTWEVGAIATILAAILAVLLAVSMTRAAEDDGTIELLRSCGLGPRVPLRSAMAILAAVATILTVGCSAAVGVAVGRVDDVTWPGALAFGSVIGLTFLLVAVLTLVLAQVAPTTADAHLLGFAGVGVAFGIRAIADTQHVGWLNWVSPLGLRASVRPFLDNRWWVLLSYVVAALALAWVATALADQREYGAGLVQRRDRHDVRLNVGSSFALAWRLARPSVITWTVAVAGIGTMFSALGSGVVQQDDLGGFLGSQLGAGDPIAGYFAYSGTVVAIAVSVFAVQCMLGARQDEVDGLTDNMLATGVRRWVPLAAQMGVTAVGSAIILLATGLLSAVIAPTVISGTDVSLRAFAYAAGQWPAVMAAAGWTALLIGCRPRLTGLAWSLPVVSGTFALLGQLLGIPQWLLDLGLFRHVPDISSASPDVRALFALVALSGAACLLGVVSIRRRDVTTG